MLDAKVFQLEYNFVGFIELFGIFFDLHCDLSKDVDLFLVVLPLTAVLLTKMHF